MGILPTLRHMIIFLPGIMGSTLYKDGKSLWELSGVPLWQHLRALRDAWGGQVKDLELRDDDWKKKDIGDGVVAINIIKDIHSVPGIIQHAGYADFLSAIARSYSNVKVGSIHAPREYANFYPFPYDWRRDNRATALILQHFIEEWLPRWRQWSLVDDAHVILVGHSMGGLIARYYVEVLGGWKTCQWLITVGTPHRGSINVLDPLSNGVKKIGMDMTKIVRSLTSAYQLLPVYPCVNVNGTYVRPAETDLPNIEREQARLAREEFHEVIRMTAIANRNEPGYQQRTIPWVGFRQDTLQSAFIENGKLITSYHLPPIVDPTKYDGDGTVPHVSAIPSDFSTLEEKNLPRYAVEQHGWLTNNPMTLEPLLATLTLLMSTSNAPVHGEPSSAKVALNVRLDPAVLEGEPIAVRVMLADRDESVQVEVRLIPVELASDISVQFATIAPDTATTVMFEDIDSGLYRIEVRTLATGLQATNSVHGVVEVVGDKV